MPVDTTAERLRTIGRPLILAQSAVPVILAPNGTVAADGAITLVTALPTTYSGGAWVRLPAGAVVGGLAGLYWIVFSSTTVGAVKTLFVDPATPFTPYVPSVGLVVAVGSGVAYTQTTGADITLANITVPGGMMGLNGVLRSQPDMTNNNSVGSKTLATKFGGTLIGSSASTTLTFKRTFSVLRNRSLYSQMFNQYAENFQSTNGINTTTMDTTVDKVFAYLGNIPAATDFIVLEGFTIEVLPS